MNKDLNRHGLFALAKETSGHVETITTCLAEERRGEVLHLRMVPNLRSLATGSFADSAMAIEAYFVEPLVASVAFLVGKEPVGWKADLRTCSSLSQFASALHCEGLPFLLAVQAT